MIANDRMPDGPALAKVRIGRRIVLALWRDRELYDLSPMRLDWLLGLPAAEIRQRLENLGHVRRLDLAAARLLAPIERQEVWGAGVTFSRSRDTAVQQWREKDLYERAYEAERPVLYYKAAGWRVVADGEEIGIRPDSTSDAAEPELAVLVNAWGEIVAYSCANDMGSRSIEGENPLYLPQAKIYDRSCSIGPAAALAWGTDITHAAIHMIVNRDGQPEFDGYASLDELARFPSELGAVLRSVYSLPVGAWLLTGASIVPDPPHTARSGDVVRISIDRIGTLINTVVTVPHTWAKAPPHLPDDPPRHPRDGSDRITRP